MRLPKSVKVVGSPNGVGLGTRVYDAETGAELHCVETIGIPTFGPGDVVRVELVIGLAQFEMQGRPTFYVLHPETKKPEPISLIRFADGTEIEAD